MTALIITLIILATLFAASGWLAYGYTIKLIGERDAEKERYKKALELVDARAQEAIVKATDEAQAWQERSEAEFARGKQEGKRATLAWIKQQVDDGTLEVRVIGEPVRKS